MTATDELRRLLDERGVEWMPSVWSARDETFYKVGNTGFLATEMSGGRMKVCIEGYVVPAQAVEATLGSDLQAENEQLRRERDFYFRQVTENGERADGAIDALNAENAELRELVRDYEELAAALCDARECDGCPFDSEWTICEHMRLIARVGELGVDDG